ncbi:hypothetical protein [Dyella mobilis]|uniref:Uncharacterized protein n=1 Tax=Dyella mobilis TaxID=1849582 RepID=A0ABS2KNL6_9GAMM|nr:hypothetical protein [Dyella mobilis]MBM7132402.1 hypothetical protein [Dyella mobilis]
MKMNWLWRLTCDVGHVGVDEVVSALAKADVRVERKRAQGWLKSEGEDGYFPLTIAELEQNLRALQASRSDPLPHEADNDSTEQP